MSEREHDNPNDSLAESLTRGAGSVPSAGPLPGVLRDRLHARRRVRRARLAGGAVGVLGAGLLAVAMLVRFGPWAASPTEPAPPNNVIAENDPPSSPDRPREADEPLPLRFDDPMFAALDTGIEQSPPTEHWTIGSTMRGEWPSGL